MAGSSLLLVNQTAAKIEADTCGGEEPLLGYVPEINITYQCSAMLVKPKQKPNSKPDAHCCLPKPLYCNIVGSFTCQTLIILEALNKGLHSFYYQKEY
jgi:hypothetical protein